MKLLYGSTPKEWIRTLPRAEFKGRIVVIQSLEEAQCAIRMLSKARIVGFDSETRPSFKKGNRHSVSLIQLSTEDICFLFRVHYLGIPKSLVALFSSPDVVKVGLSLKDDFQQIRMRQSFTPTNFVDLQTIAVCMGLKDCSLQKLYANFFAERISKSAQLTNWEADVLTEAQKRYAALDAYACLRLYHEMNELAHTGNYTLIATNETSLQL